MSYFSDSVHKLAFKVLLLLFISCSSKPENNFTVLKVLEEGLINTENSLTQQNATLYVALQEKLAETGSYERASFWHPKAMLIRKYSSDISDYLERLKNDLKKEIDYRGIDVKVSFKEDDMTVVNTFFKKNGRGKELYEKLSKYKQEILDVDTFILKEFNYNIILIPKSYNTIISTHNEFIETFFNHVTPLAALAMLSQLKNHVKETEYKTVEFCYHNTYAPSFGFYRKHSVIVAQNNSYLKPQQPLEIYAGVGNFSRPAKLEIIINGKLIPVDADGLAIYKSQAAMKPGKHLVPVKISYISEEGMPIDIQKTIEYTVVDKRVP